MRPVLRRVASRPRSPTAAVTPAAKARPGDRPSRRGEVALAGQERVRIELGQQRPSTPGYEEQLLLLGGCLRLQRVTWTRRAGHGASSKDVRQDGRPPAR